MDEQCANCGRYGRLIWQRFPGDGEFTPLCSGCASEYAANGTLPVVELPEEVAFAGGWDTYELYGE